MGDVTTRELECDVFVAGGGISGVCCALAAARTGARVILCQDRPVLGGNASSEVRMHIVGATGLRDGVALQVENREGGIIEELRLEAAVRNPQRSPAMFDLLLYDKCRREPRLTLLLNATVIAVEREGRVIRRAVAERPSTEERFTISATVFVDCTGDGRMAAEAGAAFRQGREGRAEFNESLAADVGDRRTLGSTLLFQARRHPQPMPFIAPPWARRFRAEDLRLRPFAVPGSDLGLEYGYWWLEWGGELDTIRDNERIRDELVAILLGVWDHIKNHSGADASHWALEWMGFLPGKRESRRFIGQHILSERDVRGAASFADAIAYGGWPIDTHPPAGVDAADEPPCHQHHLDYLYDIPLRCCVSADAANLMFAGRNLSATHIAFASTRVMATCAVVGQGVGTAAALAVRAGVAPEAIAANADLMKSIRQRLLRDDCYLIGAANEDEADLARRADISASSAQAGGEPGWVLSGQTRSVHGPAPAGFDLTVGPPDRCRPGSHRWMSDPAGGLPAWLELRWRAPVTVSQVELTFDTGMHRHLTLTQAEGFSRRMVWGRPQPETVRAYRLEAEAAPGQWLPILTVDDNFQRRRVHAFPAVAARALRIVVAATHGLDHARLFAVRVYG